MKRILYATFLSVFAFTACQKNNDAIGNGQGIEGTWAVTGITADRAYDFNGDGYAETDIYGSYSACGRDIVAVFNAGGQGRMRQGCNAPWQNMTWSLVGTSTLNISLPNDDLALQLSRLDNSTIRGVDGVLIDGNYHNITYTFQRR